MEKFKMKCGYTAFRATAKDTFKLGGRGKCDHCNEFSPNGYLVPVLNHYLCPGCYETFDKNAVFFPSDSFYENNRILVWETVFKGEITEAAS